MVLGQDITPKPRQTGLWSLLDPCVHNAPWSYAKRRFRTGTAVLCLLILAVSITGCSRKRSRAQVPVSTRPPLAAVVGASEEGIASWYGHPYHGRRTANGEIYDQDLMTAAHPTLTFNTWVRVYNLDNGLETEVRINDRGPFAKGRAIDLSRAAAREIAMIGPGTARVRVVVTKAPAANPPPRPPANPPSAPSPASGPAPNPAASASGYALQFGAFRSIENATSLRSRVAEFLADARVVASKEDAGLWLVLGGDGLSRQEADAMARDLDKNFPRVFPVPSH